MATEGITNTELLRFITEQTTRSRSFDGVYASRDRLLDLLHLEPRDVNAAFVSLLGPLRAQLHSYSRALSNVNEAVSLVNVLSTAVSGVDTELASMEALAEEATHVKMTDSERALKDVTYAQHADTVYTTAATTEYGGLVLLNGSVGGMLEFNLGAQGDPSDAIKMKLPTFTESVLFGGASTISTLATATQALADVLNGRQSAQTTESHAKATLRSMISQDRVLTTILSFLETAVDRLQREPQVAEDVDEAREQLLSDTTVGLLSQANQSPLRVMDLLEVSVPVAMKPFSYDPNLPLDMSRKPPFVNVPDSA